MIVIRTVAQIAIIWLFYLMGVLIVEWTGIFIPPSIVGLVLLWGALSMNWLNVKFIKDGAGFLITFLTIFFIPATVGVIDYPELLTTAGLLLVLAVILSTIVAIVVTGKVSQWIERKEHSLEKEVTLNGSHTSDC